MVIVRSQARSLVLHATFRSDPRRPRPHRPRHRRQRPRGARSRHLVGPGVAQDAVGGDRSAVTTVASSALAVGPYAATRTPRTPHSSHRRPKTTAWSSGFEAPSNLAVDSATKPLGWWMCPHLSQRSRPSEEVRKSALYPLALSESIASRTVGSAMEATVGADRSRPSGRRAARPRSRSHARWRRQHGDTVGSRGPERAIAVIPGISPADRTQRRRYTPVSSNPGQRRERGATGRWRSSRTAHRTPPLRSRERRGQRAAA